MIGLYYRFIVFLKWMKNGSCTFWLLYLFTTLENWVKEVFAKGYMTLNNNFAMQN